MKWFKHETNAIHDEKIQELIECEGIVGYAIFFILCELCAGKIDENLQPKLFISWSYIQRLTHCRRPTVERVLDSCATLGLLSRTFADDVLSIEIPNLLKRLDNWTARSVVTTEQLPLEENKNKNKKRIEGEYPENFIKFYQTYPLKKAKPLALRAWLKISPGNGLFEKIMCALKDHKRSDQWAQDNGKYIPHPATWLNQKRWEDELKVGSTSEDMKRKLEREDDRKWQEHMEKVRAERGEV